MQWHRLDHMQTVTAPCCTQITTPTPHHSFIYRLDALPDPTVSKHWRHTVMITRYEILQIDWRSISRCQHGDKTTWRASAWAFCWQWRRAASGQCWVDAAPAVMRWGRLSSSCQLPYPRHSNYTHNVPLCHWPSGTVLVTCQQPGTVLVTCPPPGTELVTRPPPSTVLVTCPQNGTVLVSHPPPGTVLANSNNFFKRKSTKSLQRLQCSSQVLTEQGTSWRA